MRREEKEYEKQKAIIAAQQEVEQFEDGIELLLSLHKEYIQDIDWHYQARALPSPLPFRVPFDELKEQRRRLLATPNSQWTSTLSTTAEPSPDRGGVEGGRALARGVLTGNGDAYVQAINNYSRLDEVVGSDGEIELIFHSPERFEIVLQLCGMEVIPEEEKGLRASGKISVRKMPEKRRNKLYQDYLCSCMLRIAMEAFAVLPIQELLVHTRIPLQPDTAAEAEMSPVYSVILPRDGFCGLNFEDLDPTDTIESFPHRGDCKASRKAGAFRAIQPLAFTPVPQLSTKSTLAELRQRVVNLREVLTADSYSD